MGRLAPRARVFVVAAIALALSVLAMEIYAEQKVGSLGGQGGWEFK